MTHALIQASAFTAQVTLLNLSTLSHGSVPCITYLEPNKGLPHGHLAEKSIEQKTDHDSSLLHGNCPLLQQHMW